MTAEVVYIGQLRTEAKHIKSGSQLITDAPVDNRGKGEAFSPTDMVATALASCMLTIMGIKCADNGWDFEGSSASVTKVMASNPRRIAEIQISFELPASFDSKQRKILEKVAEACPVSKSLSTDLQEKLAFNWVQKKPRKS